MRRVFQHLHQFDGAVVVKLSTRLGAGNVFFFSVHFDNGRLGRCWHCFFFHTAALGLFWHTGAFLFHLGLVRHQQTIARGLSQERKLDFTGRARVCKTEDGCVTASFGWGTGRGRSFRVD